MNVGVKLSPMALTTSHYPAGLLNRSMQQTIAWGAPVGEHVCVTHVTLLHQPIRRDTSVREYICTSCCRLAHECQFLCASAQNRQHQ